MSWRKFTVLLGGLSPNSLFVNKLTSKEEVIEDPVLAERAVERFW